MSQFPDLSSVVAQPVGLSGDIVSTPAPQARPPATYGPDTTALPPLPGMAPPPKSPFPWGSLLLTTLAAAGIAALAWDHHATMKRNGDPEDEDEDDEDDEDEDEDEDEDDEDETDIFGASL
jgi:hypothetical protein